MNIEVEAFDDDFYGSVYMPCLGLSIVPRQVNIGKMRWSTYSLYKHVIPYKFSLL